MSSYHVLGLVMFSKTMYQSKVDLKQVNKKSIHIHIKYEKRISKQVGALLSKQKKALMLLLTSLEVEKERKWGSLVQGRVNVIILTDTDKVCKS